MKDDGGTAFPQFRRQHSHIVGGDVTSISGGMSLRDWFAGMAMTKIIGVHSSDRDFDAYKERARVTAASCYMCADALIAEREKGQDDGETTDD